MRLAPKDAWWGDQPLELPEGAEPAGYARMVRDRRLDVMPNHRWSFIARIGGRQSWDVLGVTWEVFQSSYRPDGVAGQLEFALKYDGVSFEILRAWFEAFEPDDVGALVEWILRFPTSAYARRAWFLYEHLTERELPVPDASTGAYAPLLDPERYFTTAGQRSRRHRVLDNALGDRRFSPTARRTRRLEWFSAQRLDVRFREVLDAYDPDSLMKAMTYLYTKETRSSFEIENEKPSSDRVRRFVQVLRAAHAWEDLGKQDLVRLQNMIVADPRVRDDDYRGTQNYVGRSGIDAIDFIAPRPSDLPALMDGWLRSLATAIRSDVDPVVAAAVMSFAFVFLHPFEDGNGRIHRFLIHYVLARKGFSPEGSLVPVSATMLARLNEYDAILEQFSEPLMARLEYDVDANGIVTVQSESANLYRYPDLTHAAEALYGWVAATIENDLPKELAFTLAYRDAQAAVRAVIELPDPKIDHFIARTMEHGGRLSNTRRKRDFPNLHDDELDAMETAVREAMQARGMTTR